MRGTGRPCSKLRPSAPRGLPSAVAPGTAGTVHRVRLTAQPIQPEVSCGLEMAMPAAGLPTDVRGQCGPSSVLLVSHLQYQALTWLSFPAKVKW